MKKFLITLATVAALMFADGPSNPALAYYNEPVAFYVQQDGSGEYTVLYEKFKNPNTGEMNYRWVHYDSDDNVIASGWINPDPTGDGGTEPGDEKSRLNLLLQKGGPLNMTPAFAKTPLGKLLISKGTGLVPVYQPSDDEGGDPSTGAGGSSDLDVKTELEPENFGNWGGIPYDPSMGPIEEFVKSKLGKGPPPETGDDGDGDSSDEKLGTDSGVLFGDLPGPPELVNPDPVTRDGAAEQQPGAAAQLPSDAAGGAAGGRTSPSTAVILSPPE